MSRVIHIGVVEGYYPDNEARNGKEHGTCKAAWAHRGAKGSALWGGWGRVVLEFPLYLPADVLEINGGSQLGLVSSKRISSLVEGLNPKPKRKGPDLWLAPQVTQAGTNEIPNEPIL